MISYFDTSALLKIYINEKYSDLVRKFINEQHFIYISQLSFVEVHSSFSRYFNEKHISKKDLSELQKNFNNDFKLFNSIKMDMNILTRASELTYSTNLRTLDSIHLATIEHLKLSSEDELIFACFDNKLIEGASLLGIEILKF